MEVTGDLFPLKDIKDKGNWLKHREFYTNKLIMNGKKINSLNLSFGKKTFDTIGSEMRLNVKSSSSLAKQELTEDIFYINRLRQLNYNSPLLRWKIFSPNYNNGKFVMVSLPIFTVISSPSPHAAFINKVMKKIKGTYLQEEFIKVENERCWLNASSMQCTSILKQLDQMAPIFNIDQIFS